MKKIFSLLVLFLLFLNSLHSASGYAQRGRQEEGAKLYIVNGAIGEVPVSVILISEIANGSQARFWEVAIVIQVQDEEQAYWVKISDNHIERDKSIPGDSVLESDEGKVVGTKVFGPWVVYANGDPDWGDLVWTISIHSLDGRERYLHFIMKWGYGVDAPLKIEIAEDIEDAIGAGGGYAWYHVLEAMALFGLGTYTAFKKSKDNVIEAGKYSVRDDA